MESLHKMKQRHKKELKELKDASGKAGKGAAKDFRQKVSVSPPPRTPHPKPRLLESGPSVVQHNHRCVC